MFDATMNLFAETVGSIAVTEEGDTGGTSSHQQSSQRVEEA
jgi:hypothetical protein